MQKFPQAEDAPIEVVGTWTDETHTSCTWIVKADSFWKYTLKEYNYKPKDSNVKFSGWYNVRNSHEEGDNVNSWEAYPESGIKFTGRGIDAVVKLLLLNWRTVIRKREYSH